MIEAAFFCNELRERGTDFFAGVPDSLLKHLCAYLAENVPADTYHIAVNEGAAVALACGYHFATGKIPLIFMQNSGLGNAVNPLLSLADGDVYRVPLVLVIGWRGEPGVPDEPQHSKQGRVTRELLGAMEIPFVVLAKEETAARRQVAECYESIARTGSAFAFLVQKDTFLPYRMKSDEESGALMSREEAIEAVVTSAPGDHVIVSTTGMASRELYELREKYRMGHERDFLTVGSMGHASQIALGIAHGCARSCARQKNPLRVIVLDGDGAVLMHLGALASLGVEKPENVLHIVLNNRAHDSVGGQPTIAGHVDLCGIARACGYERVLRVETRAALQEALKNTDNGLTFIEVVVKKGSRQDLGRPRSTPEENKIALMRYVQSF
ncbi:MAG: phosphonopyruvate decarboxylase [Spirochaetaceae bacterium]|jgi:phosphonopyruvate decarboxylase|nr:phosphonopyruvate decarboxylase [Spirochaetaceae bacterium]